MVQNETFRRSVRRDGERRRELGQRGREGESNHLDENKGVQNNSSANVSKKRVKRKKMKSKSSATSLRSANKPQIRSAVISTEEIQPEKYDGRFDCKYLSQLADDTTDEETVHFIYKNIVDFESFLNSELTQTKCFLVIKIAAKITNALPLQHRNAIYAKIYDRIFIDNLIRIISDLYIDKKCENISRELFNNLIILFKHFVDHYELQVDIDRINNVMLTSEKIADRFPFLTDISKKIKMERQKLLKSQDVTKTEPGSRESYKTASLYPLVEDFRQTDSDVFKSLSQNVIEGSYKDLEHYLNVQFHLLREDFISPLRAGMKSYKQLLNSSQRGSKEQDPSLHIYKGVKVLSGAGEREQPGDISYRVQLNRKHASEISWEDTKRLLFGSLVMFSNDDFISFQLAVVTERNVESLKKGYLSVKLVGRDVYESHIHRGRYVMAESDAFFEPVYQTLKILQSMQRLPMEKYFLVHDVSPRRPLYMSLGPLIKLESHVVALNDDSTWPDHAFLNLNESQFAALKASLREEFVVIQGPPGTGKTFIALKIIKVLLNNFTSVTPQLILSYTNHALDQFLEGTLKFTKRVVRIGGQSKNKALEQYNFQNIKDQLLNNFYNRPKGQNRNWYTRKNESGEMEEVFVNWPKKIDRSLPVLKRELKRSHLEIQLDTEVLRTIEEELGLVSVPYYHRRMGVEDSTSIENNDNFLVWLLGKSYKTVKCLIRAYEGCDVSSETQDELDVDMNISKNLDLENNPEELTKNEKNIIRSRVPVTFEMISDFIIILRDRQDAEKETIDSIQLLENLHASMKNVLDSSYYSRESIKDDNQVIDDLWSLSFHKRWGLYKKWVEQIRIDIVRELKAKKSTHAEISSILKEKRTKSNLELLVALNPDIIGITTSGAAKHHQLISSLAPRIVVIEEAAHVLEAHIASSLTNSCQHLILIGDHKQLRPSTSTHELAMMFNLDISLFERMVKNGVGCNTLNVQHRMKPNIAALITPAIYPQLANHASVSSYPPIRGVLKNLFFIDHSHLEMKNSASRCNPHEAEFMIALCRYLILQGYEASDIVILTTYSSQTCYLRDLQKEDESLEGVRMTTVDNYQGEECNIVLLSLVRSNREGNIGFLGAENRVCVALSRAKRGLYIIGNMELLKSRSTLWKQIDTTLHTQQAIGKTE